VSVATSSSTWALVLILIVALTMPWIAGGQETVEAPVVDETSAVVLPEPEPIVSESEMLPEIEEIEEIIEELIEETPLETSTETVEEVIEETEAQEEQNEEEAQPIIPYIPPRPTLSVRNFKKNILIDPAAAHSCEAETFRIDISDGAPAQANIRFFRDTDERYEMEIGGLPDGIDVSFERDGLYRHTQGPEDRYLALRVAKQAGAQKGNFSIPIIYTRKGNKDSSVICQINIVNQ
jgi:hypothetical protein